MLRATKNLAKSTQQYFFLIRKNIKVKLFAELKQTYNQR